MIARRLFFVAVLVALLRSNTSAALIEADVCVFGATSAGITAAIQTARMGKTVALIEPGKFLGGLTTGGLGATDIGNKAALGGISREFYRRLGHLISLGSITEP